MGEDNRCSWRVHYFATLGNKELLPVGHKPRRKINSLPAIVYPSLKQQLEDAHGDTQISGNQNPFRSKFPFYLSRTKEEWKEDNLMIRLHY